MPGDLELDDHIRFQRREWRFQRAGWLAMTLVVAASCLGYFGFGPASKREKAAPGGWTVSYERFLQRETDSHLTLRLPEAPAAGPQKVWLSDSFVDAVDIERIVPQPASSAAGDGGVYFLFLKTPGPAEISFYFRTRAVGQVVSRVGPSPQEAVPIRQFCYP